MASNDVYGFATKEAGLAAPGLQKRAWDDLDNAAYAEPPKMASNDVYGFATKEAGLAAPGLLGQMSSAVRRMGKATNIAAQRAGNAFQAERSMSKLTGSQLPYSGLGRSLVSAGQAGVDSLMKSQAGRRVIGTGVGLGAAGTLAAGNAAYNATFGHGFNGPSYSDDPGTPVNMSLINPSAGSRVGHGIYGGILGGLGGAGLGMAAGSAFGGSGVGAAVGGLGGAILGGLHGYRNAPKELILRHGAAPAAPAASAEPPKMASNDVYGFATKEAGLAAPGLLGQMSSAVRRMGKATSIAAQRAGNAFQAERGVSKLTGSQLPNSGLGRSLVSAGQAGVDSLMKSQAGRRVIGTGLGLGAAGTFAAGNAVGNAAYNAMQPKPPVALPR